MKTLFALLLLAAALPAVAQVPASTTPALPTGIPKATRYELGIWRSPADPATTPPWQLTQFPVPTLSCGRLPMEDAPDNVPNPTRASFQDVDDPTKVCVIDVSPVIIGLPLGVGYRFALRAVAPNTLDPTLDVKSEWAIWPKTFRRAPRGLPCPNGLPGVLFTGENDIDGKPVHLTICVSQ